MKRTLGFKLVLASLILSSSALFAHGVIKIGVQAPITGKYASEGQAIDNFVRLIAKQENAKGGIIGKKITVLTCDDEGKSQKAAVCARKFSDAKVLAVIGSYTSNAALAAQTIYFRNHILQTTDGTSNKLIAKKYWTFFRNSYPNSAEGSFTAKYLVKDRHFKKIVVLSDYSSYSNGLANATEASIKDIGGNVVYRGKIKSGTQNFTAILTKIKALKPDAIYFSGYFSDGGLIRSQQKELGIKAVFVGGDSNDNPNFAKLAGDAAKGSLIINFPSPKTLPYKIAKTYIKAYKTAYKTNLPSIFPVLNADGLRVILYAIKTIKSTDTKKISNFLHNLKNYPGITGPITFRNDGERINVKFLVYQLQKDGSYKVLNK